MLNNQEIRVHLVGFPYFFKPASYGDGTCVYLNFNKLYWDTVFSQDILRYINPKSVTNDDINDLRFILKNILIAKNIFLFFKHEDLSIHHLLFAFNVINSLLTIMNKHLPFEEIFFFNYFKYREGFGENITKTLIYRFYLSNLEKFSNIQDNTTLSIKLNLSEQIMQLEVLNLVLAKLKIKPSISIDITQLEEFENKHSIQDYIKNIFKSTGIQLTMLLDKDNIENLAVNGYFLGHKNISCYVYNKGCSYRKCTFCNIGKFLPKVKDISENILHELVRLSRNSSFDVLHISDPDIQPEEILHITHHFHENNVDIKIHIRTRFSHKYTLPILRELYRGGVRFMGVGLESASPRINKLMKKYNEDITTEDFDTFIENCSLVGLGIHIYTIFGFPTETKREINMTKKFLLKNFKKYPFFTFTPLLFGLSKGTYVYNNPEEFNLKFKSTGTGEDMFIGSIYEKNIRKNEQYLIETTNSLINKMFFDNKFLLEHGRNFWYFIENSGLFHIYKMHYEVNPFLNFFRSHDTLNRKKFLIKYYFPSKYFQFVKVNGVTNLKNWINLTTVPINTELEIFFSNYDPNLRLIDNISKYNLSFADIESVYLLIKNYFFILKHDSK